MAARRADPDAGGGDGGPVRGGRVAAAGTRRGIDHRRAGGAGSVPGRAGSSGGGPDLGGDHRHQRQDHHEPPGGGGARGRGPVAHNAAGSNMLDGAVAALMDEPRARLCVLEVDELHLGPVLDAVRPDVLVLLNLSRDQLDRVSEVRSTARAVAGVLVQHPETLVVANVDDPMVVWAVRRARAGGVGRGRRRAGRPTPWPARCARHQLSRRPDGTMSTSWWCSGCGLRRPGPAVVVGTRAACRLRGAPPGRRTGAGLVRTAGAGQQGQRHPGARRRRRDRHRSGDGGPARGAGPVGRGPLRASGLPGSAGAQLPGQEPRGLGRGTGHARRPATRPDGHQRPRGRRPRRARGCGTCPSRPCEAGTWPWPGSAPRTSASG